MDIQKRGFPTREALRLFDEQAPRLRDSAGVRSRDGEGYNAKKRNQLAGGFA